MRNNILLVLSLVISTATFSQQSIDKVVAKVGENIILRSELEIQKLQYIQEKIEVTPEMDCQILEELMFQFLLLNQAELDSITVTDQQVDAELEQRIRYFEAQIGGREELEKFYGKSVFEIKAEFRKIIKDRLIAQEMERTITADIAVSPREVRDFFNEIPRDSLPYINARVGLQQIVIYPKLTDEDKQKAKTRLEEIRRRIIQGYATFSSEAVKNSDDPGSASQGGLIEAYKGQMVKEFDAMAFSMQVGEVSPVFETTYGFHIMKLESRRGDAYTCRHILIIPEVSDAEFDKAIQLIEECNRALINGTITWEEAVAKYSNDKNSKSNNGNVVNPYTGEPNWDLEDLNEIDRQMALLISGLNPGQVSAPSVYENRMENKTGVRIVRLVSRTSPHRANMTDDYQMIQNAALNRKKQEEVARWANQNISNTFVRIAEEYQNCNFLYKWIRVNP